MIRLGSDRLQKITANATLACFVLLLGTTSALAQGLPDPTRPPPGFVDPADAAAAGSGRGEAAAPGPGPAATQTSGLVLQSVLLPQSGKPVAVISGNYVPLGATVAGWELNKVGERDVTLTRAGEEKMLSLTPLVRKTPVASAAIAEPDKQMKPARAKKAKKPRKAS